MRGTEGGSGVCEPLAEGQHVDLEDIAYIDPGEGAVALQGIEGAGTFFGTPFGLQEINVPTSSRRPAAAQPKPVLIVKLLGGSYKQCSGKNRLASGLAGGTLRAAKKPIADCGARVRVVCFGRGRYASGTVRGTNWLTQDFCEGTSIRVSKASSRSTTL